MMQPIVFSDFLLRTGFTEQDLPFLQTNNITHVISLRDMAVIDTVVVMPWLYCVTLVSKIGLIGAPEIKVYARCPIHLEQIEPSQLRVGQRFVYRKKYTAIMENFRHMFKDFSVSRGIARLTPMIVLGRGRSNTLCLAHYLPPIVEAHSNQRIIMDGINRNFVAYQSGPIESIVVERVNVTFPCEARPWDDISVVDDKPERQEDRYFDFQPELFRDLKSIGIDG